MQRAVFLLIAVLIAPWVAAEGAQAGLRVCNNTNVRVDAAFAREDSSNGWYSQGWWIVDPGNCKEMISAPLHQRYLYVYAEGGTTQPRMKFTGKAEFCVQMKKFKLYQSQFGKTDKAGCAAAGLLSARFFEVDTQGSQNHTVTLRGVAGAQAAGPRPGPQPVPGNSPPPNNSQPPTGPPAGGNGGTACQRFPNLC